MSLVTPGVVRGGHVVPDTPLPEGARVEVRLAGAPELPDELREELAAWGRASDRALALAEGPPTEGAADAAR